jgi:hypothetical protein
MSSFSLSPLFDLQLFAEDGAAGTGGQETAALARPQTGAERSSSPAGQEGGTPDAGEHRDAAADRAARFESLIKGEYKDLYDKRVQDTIQKRLKGSAGIVQKYRELSPALELLGRRYGVDATDPEALRRAIQEDAPASGDEEESKAPEQTETLRQERARRQLSDWLRQAEVTKSRYPSFDLQQEARDPRFRSLLRSGVPLQTAFEVLHQQEILPAAMAYSARRAEERMADSVIAGQLRPAEGAMGGQSPVLSKRDVKCLTRAERDEIDRRVARGEKIRF